MEASGPYQMFEFLGDMVLFDQNHSTQAPEIDSFQAEKLLDIMIHQLLWSGDGMQTILRTYRKLIRLFM